MKTRYLLGNSALLGLFALTSAQAADAVAPVLPGAAPGVAEGVTVVPPPPVGFDARTASPAERTRYTVPPAPDADKDPKGYARWLRAVAPSSTPRKTPVLTPTIILNGPVRDKGLRSSNSLGSNVVGTTSSNWSGSVIENPVNPSNLEVINSVFVVPTGHQAFGACTGGWDWSFFWPGIDGWNSSDVLQGGVEADSYCSGSMTENYYSAWIEWYPFSETRVSEPEITPGDEVFVEVWNVSATSGYVYFFDYSANGPAYEYQLTAPPGTTLQGNSAEWVTERPTVGGSLATLTNYIDSTWIDGQAWNWSASSPTYYYMYYPPTSGTLALVEMLDNNGNGISYGYGLGYCCLYFEDFGSAW